MKDGIDKTLLVQIGIRVMQLRESSGLSLEELAASANMSLSRAESIERGSYNLRVDDLTDLSDALQIPIYKLLEGIDL